MPSKKQIEAALTPCVMLTKQGTSCGKDGQLGLPAGVCAEHAVQIYRSVSKLMDLAVAP